jgi:eukaryotic-like serine/threonine-protein kinase
MDQQRYRRCRDLLQRALDLPPVDRQAFLVAACGDDQALLTEVQQLLDHDVSGAEEAAAAGAPDLIGATIGPYRILETLGEGGMGEVYLADQGAPLRRQVAIKVIKVGMDTREVIARFETERQALALMNHPNIARVLDAGATASGRPYFVMEFIPGCP